MKLYIEHCFRMNALIFVGILSIYCAETESVNELDYSKLLRELEQIDPYGNYVKRNGQSCKDLVCSYLVSNDDLVMKFLQFVVKKKRNVRIANSRRFSSEYMLSLLFHHKYSNIPLDITFEAQREAIDSPGEIDKSYLVKLVDNIIKSIEPTEKDATLTDKELFDKCVKELLEAYIKIRRMNSSSRDSAREENPIPDSNLREECKILMKKIVEIMSNYSKGTLTSVLIEKYLGGGIVKKLMKDINDTCRPFDDAINSVSNEKAEKFYGKLGSIIASFLVLIRDITDLEQSEIKESLEKLINIDEDNPRIDELMEEAVNKIKKFKPVTVISELKPGQADWVEVIMKDFIWSIASFNNYINMRARLIANARKETLEIFDSQENRMDFAYQTAYVKDSIAKILAMCGIILELKENVGTDHSFKETHELVELALFRELFSCNMGFYTTELQIPCNDIKKDIERIFKLPRNERTSEMTALLQLECLYIMIARVIKVKAIAAASYLEAHIERLEGEKYNFLSESVRRDLFNDFFCRDSSEAVKLFIKNIKDNNSFINLDN